MRLTLIALAAALAASAAPAAAYDTFASVGAALADDDYPPGASTLPPTVQRLVIARQGKGLSLAGFCNDPALAYAAHYAPASYDYAPEFTPPPQVAPDYVEAPPAPAEYGYDRHRRGPRVIFSPYGHSPYGHERRFARDHERRHVY